MAVMIQPWFFLCSFLFFIHLSSCQSLNQNIETFYPFPPPLPSPSPSPGYSYYPPPNGTRFPPLPSPTPVFPPAATAKPSSNKTLVKAVAATAASTFLVATLLFFFIRRYLIARRRKEGSVDPVRGDPVVLNDNFELSNGGFKGTVVDEDGLDVHYWRKLEEEIVKNNTVGYKKSFHKVFQSPEDDEEERVAQGKEKDHKNSDFIQEVPLLLGKSSNSQNKVVAETSMQHGNMASSVRTQSVKAVAKPNLTSLPSNSSFLPRPPPPAPAPPLPPQPSQSLMAVPKKQAPPPPPPPPRNSVAIPQKAGPAAPPPPPPLPVKKSSAPPPPPPPKLGGSSRSSKPPPVNEGMPLGSENGEAADGDDMAGAGNGQVKLKPLHWDKVNKNTDHSMVWDKIGGGSFRFDDDLMEALFGCVATNRKSPRGKSNLGASDPNPGQASQIVILDARKSQNIAIVLKSLGITQKGLVDALHDGEDLNADTLDKLMRIAPTKEEQTQILEFNGDSSNLADAESFLYHLLKAVPSTFTRLDAMVFRSNYDTEILQFKELLQTLELGCKELRNRGLFMKLLEAILKAGNRMNAGTARGNAQAFKLTSLQKLSDVKSTDGKTTLLHFVVEEVVRAEGKRCVLNRNRSLSRSSSIRSNGSSTVSDNSASKEEREKEYKRLGLPIVGGLSAEFSNVKRAAQIDYESFASTCSGLVARAAHVRLSLSQCGSNKESKFVRVMKDFLEAVEQELGLLKQEQTRIMDFVTKTTEFYQPGASNDKGGNPLQLFVIIREFLGMVDQVCVEIARNLQRRKSSASSVGSSPKSPATRVPVRFPNLPEHFMKEKIRSSSSESGGEW